MRYGKDMHDKGMKRDMYGKGKKYDKDDEDMYDDKDMYRKGKKYDKDMYDKDMYGKRKVKKGQIDREDVRAALKSLNYLSDDEVSKGDGVPTDGDLNSANGAANGGGDGSLKAPGDDMCDKYGNKKRKEKAMKSERQAPDDFRKGLPPEVEAKIEVSDFLKSLTDHNAARIDALRDFMVKSDMAVDDRHEELTDAVDGLQKSMGDIGVVLKALCERIGVLENTPATVAKSETAIQNVAKSEVATRQFADPNATAEATGNEGQGIYKSLVGKPPVTQKSMISEAMCDLVRKGDAVPEDVINFETYNYVPPELDSKLRAVL